MTRYNYNLPDHVQFGEAIDTWLPGRRRGLATSVPAGTTFIVSNFPAFAGAAIVGAGTAATNADAASGSAIVTVTAASAADSNNFVTATAATRRDWNPWIRFRVFTGTAGQNASVRYWIGAYSSDPSALSTLATLSAACFGWDTIVDGTAVDSTAYWKCNSGNTATQQTTTTDMPIKSTRAYTMEIRMNTASAQIEFWMSDDGASTAAKVQTPTSGNQLRRVATHATSVPVAATPLLLGATVTVLATAAAAKRITLGSVEISQD